MDISKIIPNGIYEPVANAWCNGYGKLANAVNGNDNANYVIAATAALATLATASAIVLKGRRVKEMPARNRLHLSK